MLNQLVNSGFAKTHCIFYLYKAHESVTHLMGIGIMGHITMIGWHSNSLHIVE